MARIVAFGCYSLNAVDAKGRVSFPADMRRTVERRVAAAPPEDEVEPNRIYVREDLKRPCLIGFDDVEYCRLSAMTENGWDGAALEEEALNGSDFHGELFGNLQSMAFDGAGRMVLNQMCRDVTGIDKFAFFRGVGPRFEIWEPRKLHAWASDAQKAALIRTVEYACRDKGIKL